MYQWKEHLKWRWEHIDSTLNWIFVQPFANGFSLPSLYHLSLESGSTVSTGICNGEPTFFFNPLRTKLPCRQWVKSHPMIWICLRVSRIELTPFTGAWRKAIGGSVTDWRHIPQHHPYHFPTTTTHHHPRSGRAELRSPLRPSPPPWHWNDTPVLTPTMEGRSTHVCLPPTDDLYHKLSNPTLLIHRPRTHSS